MRRFIVAARRNVRATVCFHADANAPAGSQRQHMPFPVTTLPVKMRLERSAERDKRELVGARPLHLADARPFGRLKAPLGLSLVRCAAQTLTFENTSLSAACKKKQGKLWQKERGPDGASPLDRSRYADFYFMPAHPPGVKAAMPEGTSSPARRCS